MFSRKYLVVAVATSSVALSGQLQAQEVEALRGENFTVEEVLVTARKKTENLQSVPIAIDAISTQQLEEKAITTLRDVAKYTPA